MLAIQILPDFISEQQSRFVFLADFEQVIYEIFFGRKSLFYFFVVVIFLYFLTRVTSQQYSQKTNMPQFFCNFGRCISQLFKVTNKGKQIRTNQIACSINALNNCHFNKSKNYPKGTSKGLDIKDDNQRYQIVRHCDVSKTSVSFRYDLKRFCDVLSWLVSLRHQLVRRYNISNQSVLSAFQ